MAAPITIQASTSIKANSIRTEKIADREFKVYDCVLTRSGKLNFWYWSKENMIKWAFTFKGAVVGVNHPPPGYDSNAQNPDYYKLTYMGHVFNTTYRDRADGEVELMGELWIDVEAAKTLGYQRVLDMLDDPTGEVQVSMGCDAFETGKPGNYKGQAYDTELTDFVFHHLALLPDIEGACNWEDGCGVRASEMQKVNSNSTFTENACGCNGDGKCECDNEDTTDMDAVKIKAMLTNAFSSGSYEMAKQIALAELSDWDIRNAIKIAADEKFKGMSEYKWVDSIYPESKQFIIESDGSYFRGDYEVSGEDVSIGDNLTEVERVVSYEPTGDNQMTTQTTETNEVTEASASKDTAPVIDMTALASAVADELETRAAKKETATLKAEIVKKNPALASSIDSINDIAVLNALAEKDKEMEEKDDKEMEKEDKEANAENSDDSTEASDTSANASKAAELNFAGQAGNAKADVKTDGPVKTQQAALLAKKETQTK